MPDPRRINYIALDDIAEAARNPKQHDLAGIQTSIARFGFVSPAVIDERTQRLVAGHGRVFALRAMRDTGQDPPAGVRIGTAGVWMVPTLKGWSSRSDAEAEAFLVADNEWTVRGGWDDASLGEILEELNAADPDLLAITGFTDDDLAGLLSGGSGSGSGGSGASADDEAIIPEPPADPVTRPGDIWQLGAHRLICGDSSSPDVMAALMQGRPVNVAFTSPPYASQRKYDPSSGFLPIKPDDYAAWFQPVQANVRDVLAPDGSWFVNIKEHCDDGQRHLYVKDLTIAHVREWGWRFVDELVWTCSGVPGTWPNRFKNGWEPVFHYTTAAEIKFRPKNVSEPSDDVFHEGGRVSGTAPRGNVGWSGTDVTRVSGLALPNNVVEIHPTPASMSNADVNHSAAFPPALPAWFIRAYTDPGDAVLDPFMGSGSALIAAEREGRTGYGIEISPGYCDVICRRFQAATGTKPVRESTGEAWDFEEGDGHG